MAKNDKKEKNNGLGIPQMRGQFQIQGIVTGTKKDSFFSDKPTKTNKPFRMVNFGVNVNKDSTIYMSLNGMEQEKVFFSKQDTVDGKKKTETEEVLWKDRFTFKKDGFRLIGVNTGVKKIKDAKGNDVNDKKVLVPYDACLEINDNLVDGVSVFTRGNIEYSTYNDKHQTKFIPNQVSLCKDIDFNAEDFKPTADFQQMILFMGITPNEDKTKFSIEAKIVNFDNIVDAEFIITDSKLATMFKKNLKPYTSIKVWGNINVEKQVDEVSETDCWGESNNMDRVNAPTIKELIITGADPTSIDTTTYTETIIDTAIEKIKASKKAENDFGKSDDNDGWGNVSDKTNKIDDDSEPW